MVVIVVAVLSGNVLFQYLIEASRVVTLCLLPGMCTFITCRQEEEGEKFRRSGESQHDGRKRCHLAFCSEDQSEFPNRFHRITLTFNEVMIRVVFSFH